MAQDSTPRQRVDQAVARWGAQETVRRCCAILEGEIDAELVLALGGTGAPGVLAGREGGPDGVWPRTWALRAFLYVWDPVAESHVLAAHTDPEWRVREMVAKVIAAQTLATPAAEAVAEALARDGNPRVRAAAARALA